MEDNDNTPIRHEGEENRAVNVWTPEDAARFLSSAIQEAQRPLTDALKQRSVSPGIFALVVAILVACGALGGWVLLDRLDKADRSAEHARADREAAIDKRHEVQAKQEALAAKLAAVQDQGERAKRELEAENEVLRTQAAGFKTGEEELKRLRADLNRYRRQTDLLRNQIAGLEMEKQALARQLSAVKALAAGEEDDPADLPPPASAEPAANGQNAKPEAPHEQAAQPPSAPAETQTQRETADTPPADAPPATTIPSITHDTTSPAPDDNEPHNNESTMVGENDS